MVLPISSPLLLGLSLMVLVIAPAAVHSLTCTSQNFTNNKVYANCTDLPSLSAYLHWTYHSANSSLSIAFVAAPAKPSGWIAWALNPTGTGMAGSQALLAFSHPNGSMAVTTYNISSYASIVPSRLSFDVSHASAEHSDGLMKIFATLSLPENMTEVNQVWQVGASVSNGFPKKHEFQPANLNAKAKLELVTNTTRAGSSSTRNTTSTQPQIAAQNGGEDSRTRIDFYAFLLFLGIFAFLL